jgi:subfamily B ATP-binding cassette protein MsbA
MKTYFRLLSFARPIEKFAIPYIIFTLLYVVFSSTVFVLLPSLLNTLFSTNAVGSSTAAHVVTQATLGKQPGFLDITGWFKYYMNYFILTEGPWKALQFVCATIIATILLGNLFRYLSARTMENLRVHTLLNLRRTVFNNVMDMHLGFFNNERKGDIISKIASDVQVVQFSVTATLQVIFKEPVTLIAFMVILFVYSAKLTLYSLLVVPISAFIISKIVKRLKSQAISAQQTYGTMISYLDEALSGVRIIKAFNATNFIKTRFDNENKKYSKY